MGLLDQFSAVQWRTAESLGLISGAEPTVKMDMSVGQPFRNGLDKARRHHHRAQRRRAGSDAHHLIPGVGEAAVRQHCAGYLPAAARRHSAGVQARRQRPLRVAAAAAAAAGV